MKFSYHNSQFMKPFVRVICTLALFSNIFINRFDDFWHLVVLIVKQHFNFNNSKAEHSFKRANWNLVFSHSTINKKLLQIKKLLAMDFLSP